LYFVLFIALVSAAPNTPATNDINKKTVSELMKEIAETEAKRIQLKAQTQLAHQALERETTQMAKEHKVRMNKIAKQAKKIYETNRLRESARDAKIAEIKANNTFIDAAAQAKALKNFTQDSLADIEYQRKIHLRNRIDDERRKQQIHKLKRELNAKQRKIEEQYKKQYEKEEQAFKKVRESMWRKLDNDRKLRKDALLAKELNLRKMKALELEKFKEQVEMERRMKSLTIAETQKQLFNLRKAEQIKREIVRKVSNTRNCWKNKR